MEKNVNRQRSVKIHSRAPDIRKSNDAISVVGQPPFGDFSIVPQVEITENRPAALF